MSHILIFDNPADIHSLAVRWALKRQGHSASIYSNIDFPQLATASFDTDLLSFTLDGPEVRAGPYDAVWNRRTPESTPHGQLHPGDGELALSVSADFVRAFKDVESGGAVWVNNPDAAERTERKVHQLVNAAAAGLRLPRTLISNNPERIRSFCKQQPTIVKPLSPMRWVGKDSWVTARTTRISEQMLQDDVSIRACPMIYQAEVAKEKEYRIVVMGADVVFIEIDSQKDEISSLDWRDGQSGNLSIRQSEPVAELATRIMEFMKRSGLIFGSFDFALDLEGNFIFFEINQQGQFLWVEHARPEIHLLDRMVKFLVDPHADFKYQVDCDICTFSEYTDSGQLEIDVAHAKIVHNPKPLKLPFTVYEEALESI